MNWLKLNTDGASLGNRGKAGRGGVIRGSASRWVKGFSRSIGFATNVVAECWALRDGLHLTTQLVIQNIVVELVAKTIMDILQSNQETNNFFSPLLIDCRLLLRNFPQSRVRHVLEKQNFVLMLWLKGVCHQWRL